MRLLAAALTTCLLAGCASTKIEHLWKAPEAPARKIQKFVVFGVTGSPSGRIAYEETLTQRLQAAGLPAVPGYDLVTWDEHPSRDEVVRRIKEKQIDGALVSRIDRATVKTESTPVFVGVGGATVGFYDYWYAPAAVGTYTTEETNYVVETVLFDVDDGRPYWAARTNTGRTEPTKFAKDIAGPVAQSLKESGLIGP
ncbi:MAG TPA: hypothetical protein VKE49_12225 [Myxococcaceae bacterium]|nr:hypothetical protein [Myxococcaceae bacterium]